MTYSLRYKSSRASVWRHYWRQWRLRLWRIHLAVAVAFGFVISRSELSTSDIPRWIAASAITFAALLVLSVAISQILFKSAERVLSVDPKGWSTQIGPKSGARKWSETVPITQDGENTVIANKSGNALIIPASAFSSTEERARFIQDVREWQSHVG